MRLGLVIRGPWLVVIAVLCGWTAHLAAISPVAWHKQGGACFRTDDNQLPSHWLEYGQVFTNHGFHYDFAVNLGTVSNDQVAAIRSLIDDGHECSDHTPNHSVVYIDLPTPELASLYDGYPGVDHITGRRVCLRWGGINTSIITGETTVSYTGNLLVSATPGAFSNFNVTWQLIYLPSFNRVFQISAIYNRNSADPDSLVVSSFWYEGGINLGTGSNVPYELLGYQDNSVQMDPSAVGILAERSQYLAAQYGLPAFRVWQQPGGSFPKLSRTMIKSIFGTEYGYIAGSSSADPSMKAYNLTDLNATRVFGMQWGDFCDYRDPAATIIAQIADAVAQHRVLINSSHYILPSGTTWEQYLAKLETILAWCEQEQVPVLTYEDWGNNLFRSASNPNENLFPNLDIDRDANGIPDGITLLGGSVVQVQNDSGELVKAIRKTGSGQVFRVYRLFGLEKGENLLTFDCQSSAASSCTVSLSFLTDREQSMGGISHSFSLPAGSQTSSWTFTIPEAAGCLYFLVTSNASAGTTLDFSGFVFRGNTHPDAASPLLPSNGDMNVPLNQTLTWRPGEITGDGYVLFVVDDDGVTWVNNADMGSALSYSPPYGWQAAKQYWWLVVPYRDNYDGTRTYSLGNQPSQFSTTAQPTMPLGSPTGFYIRVEDDAVVLSWKPVSSPGHVRYHVYRDSRPGFTPSTGLLFATVEDTTCSVPLDSDPGFFRVTAFLESVRHSGETVPPAAISRMVSYYDGVEETRP